MAPGQALEEALSAQGRFPVLAAKGVRVGDFNGKNLSTLNSTTARRLGQGRGSLLAVRGAGLDEHSCCPGPAAPPPTNLSPYQPPPRPAPPRPPRS
jgi:hypothetical protein